MLACNAAGRCDHTACATGIQERTRCLVLHSCRPCVPKGEARAEKGWQNPPTAAFLPVETALGFPSELLARCAGARGSWPRCVAPGDRSICSDSGVWNPKVLCPAVGKECQRMPTSPWEKSYPWHVDLERRSTRVKCPCVNCRAES